MVDDIRSRISLMSFLAQWKSS